MPYCIALCYSANARCQMLSKFYSRLDIMAGGAGMAVDPEFVEIYTPGQ